MSYQKIYNQLRRAGMTDAVALGFLGNWQQESGCEPNRLQGDFSSFRTTSKAYTAGVSSGSISRQQFGSDQKGYGLAQWTFVNNARTEGRKFDLYDFWKRSGTALDDLTMQINFVLYELMNGYRNVRFKLDGCTDLWTATDIICRLYEQPAIQNVDTRFWIAKEIDAQIDKNEWNTAEQAEEGGQTVTTDQAIAKVLTIARNEIGYREKNSNSQLDDPAANAGSGNYTKYARDLDRIQNFYNGPKQGFAWCDVFYDWLLVAAFGPDLAKRLLCQPDNSAGAGCLYSLSYFQQAGRFHIKDPQPGDQIFFTYQPGEISHTGIVEACDGSTVVTIEGNTSDSVARRSYPVGSSSIAGYGRPDWTIVSEPDTGQGEDSPPVTPPEPSPLPTCTATLPELRQGNTGTPVERLQTLLIGRGYYCGGRQYGGRETPDGDFGPATTVAVKDLQMSVSIKQDGVVGSDTWRALITS